jgi:hypothetical protein
MDLTQVDDEFDLDVRISRDVGSHPLDHLAPEFPKIRGQGTYVTCNTCFGISCVRTSCGPSCYVMTCEMSCYCRNDPPKGPEKPDEKG